MEIGIVADDLTGAADAIAPFAQRGMFANVGFKVKHSPEAFPLVAGDALAYDTATRDMSGEQSHALELAVRRAARRLSGLQPRVVFKKIDSTLRGHLRVELEAMRLEFPDRMALVCPAFPAQGRTLHTGVLHIHNVPWTATEFAPSGLFGNLTVRGAFGMEGEEGVREITLGDIRAGVEPLESRLQQWREQSVQTVFCDAERNSDLDILAQVVRRHPTRYLPVGSAGLAQALANALPLDTGVTSAAKSSREPFIRGRVLVVVGSLHHASRRQAAFLSDCLQTPAVVVYHAGDVKLELERAVSEICMRYADGQRIVVLTTPDTSDADARQDFAWMPGSVAWRVCLRQLQTARGIDSLIICGGSTAIELGQTFRGTGLRIEGEWQPGIAIGRLIAVPDAVNRVSFDGLPILTKAGGFGGVETLAQCVGLQ